MPIDCKWNYYEILYGARNEIISLVRIAFFSYVIMIAIILKSLIMMDIYGIIFFEPYQLICSSGL